MSSPRHLFSLWNGKIYPNTLFCALPLWRFPSSSRNPGLSCKLPCIQPSQTLFKIHDQLLFFSSTLLNANQKFFPFRLLCLILNKNSFNNLDIFASESASSPRGYIPLIKQIGNTRLNRNFMTTRIRNFFQAQVYWLFKMSKSNNKYVLPTPVRALKCVMRFVCCT